MALERPARDILEDYRAAMSEYEQSKLAAHKAIEHANATAVTAQRATLDMKALLNKVELTTIDAEVLTEVPAIA